jgi:nucleotide-binding universal stress UspA family protein
MGRGRYLKLAGDPSIRACRLDSGQGAPVQDTLFGQHEREDASRPRRQTMYEHILIPTDGSELADKAVRHGTTLAKAIGAKITVLTVSPPFHVVTLNTQMLEDTPAQYKRRMQDAAVKTLEAAANTAKAAGLACDTVHVEHAHPYQAIIDTAGSKGCDLIVMASHGRSGVSAIVLGSETVKVLTHSKIPVLVHR